MIGTQIWKIHQPATTIYLLPGESFISSILCLPKENSRGSSRNSESEVGTLALPQGLSVSVPFRPFNQGANPTNIRYHWKTLQQCCVSGLPINFQRFRSYQPWAGQWWSPEDETNSACGAEASPAPLAHCADGCGGLKRRSFVLIGYRSVLEGWRWSSWKVGYIRPFMNGDVT